VAVDDLSEALDVFVSERECLLGPPDLTGLWDRRFFSI
jgi:hypothetical protein